MLSAQLLSHSNESGTPRGDTMNLFGDSFYWGSKLIKSYKIEDSTFVFLAFSASRRTSVIEILVAIVLSCRFRSRNSPATRIREVSERARINADIGAREDNCLQ